jgi:hypothetical protein
VAIVGAGAAGLATAIFAGRAGRSTGVALLDGAARPGAKILVSGGSRCNVTNVAVTERDFCGGRPSIIRRVLRGFPVADTIAFFHGIGVDLHEEANGKLFPDSNRAGDVLEKLLHEAASVGSALLPGRRVLDVLPADEGFRIVTAQGEMRARTVVLATGGRSLPKSGSDGSGLAIAERLGHTIVPTTPALAPLLLADDDPLHRELSGVSQDVELAVWVDGAVGVRVTGALLWTHFGISGPAALDASRHWLRAQLDGRTVAMTASFCPGRRFDQVDAEWIGRAAARPAATVLSALGSLVPASMAGALMRRLTIDEGLTLAHLSKERRHVLTRSLVQWPIPVLGSRGYTYAEATAGGVALTEIDPATMESRVCPGLYLVGEMLDVDGRLGGFNFQWAWSSGFVAGRALGRPR